MTNTEIKEYIKEQKSFNLSEDKIRSSLESVGWIKEDIDQAFLEISKEDTIANISIASDMEKAVPTTENSGYIKDPYREPVGSGTPQAQTFIKKDQAPIEPTVNRDWVSPNSQNLQNATESRQGQKFAPKYTASQMDQNDVVRPAIPELKKRETGYVGTSFMPQKESIPQNSQISQITQNSNQPLNAFKVMPSDVSNISTGNLTNEDFNKLRQIAEPKRKKGFLGTFIIMILLLIMIFGGVLFAYIAGYINLPIKIPFIESLKQNNQSVLEDNQDIFIPKIDFTETQETIDEIEINQENDSNITTNDNITEDTLSSKTEANLEVKQDINLKDDEGVVPNQEQNIQ